MAIHHRFGRLIALALAVALVAAALPPPAAHGSGTTYYVDPATGQDGNNGTSPSAAWRTLGKVNSWTFQPGDTILLKADSVFMDQYLDFSESGAPGAPIRVGMYGTGRKPVIHFGNTRVDGNGFGVRLKNVSYFEVSDLEITSGVHPGGNSSAADIRRHGVFVVGEGAGAGHFQHIYVKNLYIHHIYGTDRRTGGINFHAKGTSSDPESTWNHIRIENNVVIDVADTGIQLMTDALTDQASGWQHEFDAFTDVVIRNNYIERIHRDGILTRASDRPLVEYNTTNKIGKATTVNPAEVSYLDDIHVVAAQWAYSTREAVFQFNEAFDTRRLGGDGQAWDFDQYVYDSIYQYNYSHNNQGGTLLVMWYTDNNTFRYNISQNDLDLSRSAFDFQSQPNMLPGNLFVYNNVIYRTLHQTNPLTNGPPGYGKKAVFKNNIFYNTAGGGYSTSPHVEYSHNLFYGNNASQPNDPNKLTADPLFVNPGSASSKATADGYKLRSGSPAINSGTTITNPGSLDFFGNALYNGTPDRGAHEFRNDSPAPEPPSSPTVLFEDRFGSVSGDWTAAPSNGWAVSGGTYALTNTGGESIATAGGAGWTDVAYEAAVRLQTANGNAGLVFRYADADNYYMFRLNAAANKLELLKRLSGSFTVVADESFAVPLNQYVTLKAVVVGNRIRGYANGALVVDWTNPVTQLSAGKIGLRAHSSAAAFDDVLATAVPANGLPLSETFESGAGNWSTVGGTWTVATDGGKVYAQTSVSGEAIAFRGYRSWGDYTYEAKVKLNTALGNAGLVFRYADKDNFYMFRLNDFGDKAELYKKVNGVLTLEADSPLAVNTGQFYTLKVIVAGNAIKGYVNGAPVVDWTNPATQLPKGRIGFRAHSASASFDDVSVTE
ncbi:family 16 glycoside hydrolase [Paenibacillus antri]|nr:family 16 glycoside hydrolase [Paenibacillus antri]